MADAWDAAGAVIADRQPRNDDWNAAGAVIPEVRSRKRTPGERFRENTEDAYRRGTLAGSASELLAVGIAQGSEQLRGVDGSRPFAGAGAAARQRNRDDREQYAARSAEDPWYRAGPPVSFAPDAIVSGETGRAIGSRLTSAKRWAKPTASGRTTRSDSSALT